MVKPVTCIRHSFLSSSPTNQDRFNKLMKARKALVDNINKHKLPFLNNQEDDKDLEYPERKQFQRYLKNYDKWYKPLKEAFNEYEEKVPQGIKDKLEVSWTDDDKEYFQNIRGQGKLPREYIEGNSQLKL